jgi:hypothetical protein
LSVHVWKGTEFEPQNRTKSKSEPSAGDFRFGGEMFNSIL